MISPHDFSEESASPSHGASGPKVSKGCGSSLGQRSPAKVEATLKPETNGVVGGPEGGDTPPRGRMTDPNQTEIFRLTWEIPSIPKQSTGSKQIRLRLPREIAERLENINPTKRRVFIATLCGQVESHWDWEGLIEARTELRRLGQLLNQALKAAYTRGEFLPTQKTVKTLAAQIEQLRLTP